MQRQYSRTAANKCNVVIELAHQTMCEAKMAGIMMSGLAGEATQAKVSNVLCRGSLAPVAEVVELVDTLS